MNSIQNKIAKSDTTTFKNRKVPRYIYHFTNKRAYDSMLKDGFIKASDKDIYAIEPSIFFVELNNFFKVWGKRPEWTNIDMTLQEALLRSVARWTNFALEGKNELVVLKVATDNLVKKMLKVRSENKFFKFMSLHKKIHEAPHSLKEHLQCKDNATQSKLLKNRGEAIEYIYQADIPIDYVEQIGTIVHIPQFRKNRDRDSQQITIEILKEVFKNTKEEMTIKHFKFD